MPSQYHHHYLHFYDHLQHKYHSSIYVYYFIIWNKKESKLWCNCSFCTNDSSNDLNQLKNLAMIIWIYENLKFCIFFTIRFFVPFVQCLFVLYVADILCFQCKSFFAFSKVGIFISIFNFFFSKTLILLQFKPWNFFSC